MLNAPSRPPTRPPTRHEARTGTTDSTTTKTMHISDTFSIRHKNYGSATFKIAICRNARPIQIKSLGNWFTYYIMPA